MMSNNLYPIALSDASDDEILKHFLHAQLPDSLIADFFTFFEATKSPIAIRSSSLLEDAHYQPFAGIYSTYMIPYLEDKYQMLQMLACAIKGVYASVFYRDSKAYMTATSNVIDQEKMAVILQEVVGKDYGTRYYPTMSGVLRSLNYYPIGDEEAEEGIASLALGLGKYIVDGGQTLRVCPYHPHQVLQTSETEMALRDTQTQFYALDMKHVGDDFKVDDGFNILKLRVKDAVEDQSLNYIASTFDPYDQVINDGVYETGRKLITFAGVLQHDVVPLPELMQMSMKCGSEAMRRPVEIEFACNIHADKTFNAGMKMEFETVDNRTLQYSYEDGDNFVFMDMTTYDQIMVPKTLLGDKAKFLLEGTDCLVSFHDGTPLSVELPASVILTITHTEPGLQGNRSNAGTKPATVETGAEIQVPLFIGEGEKVKVNTTDGSYLGREN
jgi:translation elongation factor P